MEHYLNLAVKAIFVENMALAFFLGHVLVPRRVEEGRDGDRPRASPSSSSRRSPCR